MDEGRAVAAARIRECHRYGIEELRIIYGSTERAEGTLRQAVDEAITEAHRCVANSSYRGAYGMFEVEGKSTEIRITLAINPHPLARDSKMAFAAFTARYDATRHHHEAYYPLRSSNPGQAGRQRPKTKPPK
jgi:hypothetical protein